MLYLKLSVCPSNLTKMSLYLAKVFLACHMTLIEYFLQEKLMINTLQFKLSVPTAYVFMKRFLKAAQSDKKVTMNLLVLNYRLGK